MRVSNQMMADNITAALFKQTEQLLKTQEKIVTGKKINRASDDPIGSRRVLEYRQTLAGIEQYNVNITNAKTHIDTVDDILETVTELISDAKRIAADPNTQLRDTFAQQVGTIREQLIQLANSTLNGSYIFAGDLTDTQPFDSTGAYSGDSGTKDYLVGDNIQIAVEADGSRIFQGAVDLFQVLEDLQTALLSNDTAGISNQMASLEQAAEQANQVRAQSAGQYKRLESTENHHSRFAINVQEMLSRTEDADIAQAIIDLKIQQTAYESTLATSAKIIQPSLIDFLS